MIIRLSRIPENRPRTNPRQWLKPLVSLEPRDLWVGVYWKYLKTSRASKAWTLNLYMCPFPMVLVAFRVQRNPEP